MQNRVAMTRDGAHDPRAIANKILEIANGQGKSLTIMKLIKLVYLCDGWSMALLGRPMSKQNVQAWKFGPVYPTVYSAFKHFGSSPVQGRATEVNTGLPYIETFTGDEERLIAMVVEGYGKLSAWQLSNLTHQAGTPWSEASANGAYSDISIESMLEHFNSLKDTRIVQHG